MSDFLFSNRFDSGPLYLGIRAGEAALDVELLFSVAFYAPDAADSTTDFTLAQAWDAKGTLVVMAEAPENANAFSAKLAGFGLKKNDKVIWIANPNAPVGDWVATALPIAQPANGTARLSRKCDLPLVNSRDGHFIRIEKETTFAIDASANSLTASNTDDPSSFGNKDAALPMSTPDLVFTFGTAQGLGISFSFDIPSGIELDIWLNRLGTGLTYTALASNGSTSTITYPLFGSHPEHGGLKVDTQLSFSAMTDPQVTHLTATPSDPAVNFYVSYFRTLFNRAALLELTSANLVLTFAKTANAELALSPTGDFLVHISDQIKSATSLPDAALAMDPKDHNLQLGSIGTEFIQLTPDIAKQATISFAAGNPAFVDASDPDSPSLNGNTTTSWLRISTSKALNYYAQPPGEGTLYEAASVSTNPDVPLLPYLPMVAAQIAPDGAGPFLPWVPLAGVAAAQKDAAIALETTAIAPARKARLGLEVRAAAALGNILSPLPAGRVFEDGNFTAITPRGLEAGFTEAEGVETWAHTVIARLLGHKSGNHGLLKFAGAGGIQDPLKSALLTAQQCIVMSDPAAITPFFSGEDAKITLKDWGFKLDPVDWKANGTILIVKNTEATLAELIADTGAWTNSDDFNVSPAAISNRLKAIAKDARERLAAKQQLFATRFGADEEPNTDLDFFVNTVLDDPNWNGFLFLNAGLGDPPDDLAGMSAGFKKGTPVAHHLGVTQTPFKSLADLQNQSSSMFGLISYYDDSPKFGLSSKYDFRVRELAVLFADSDITDFRSHVDLAMGPLFGQTSRTKDGGPPVVEMEGIRMLRGGADAYMFATLAPVELFFGAGPLQKIVIEQGEFVTKSIDKAGDTKTEFSFAGYLGFAVAQQNGADFDVFSFDELAFSDLLIHMDFPTQNAAKTTYTFSIQSLLLAESHTIARPKSLFEGFPAKLDRLFFNEQQSPDALGNMTVQLPGEAPGLPKSWYGLTLTLDMGALSDAAGAVGLEGKLTLAWGPKKNQMFVGLNISGFGLSGSGNELSLLGVLKLKMYSISIRQKNGAWVMMLHGMNLAVFSKTLPPGGSFEFYLFGNPDPSGSSHSMGWYGAYVADEKKKKKSTTDLLPIASAKKSLPNPNPYAPTLRRRGPRSTSGEPS